MFGGQRHFDCRKTRQFWLNSDSQIEPESREKRRGADFSAPPLFYLQAPCLLPTTLLSPLSTQLSSPLPAPFTEPVTEPAPGAVNGPVTGSVNL